MMSLGSSSSLRTLATLARRSASTSTYRVGALGLALMAGVACGDDPVTPIKSNDSGVDVVLSDTSITLVRTIQNTAQVSADVKGNSNTAVTWKSGDERIATVSQSGLVTGIADGSTFITATSVADPSKNRSVVINVVSTVVSVSPGASASYAGGPTRQITASIQNNNNTAVTWSSTNPAVATVSATGLVTPLSAGTTNIVATSVGQPEKQAATSFLVDPAPLTGYTEITAGQTISISADAGNPLKYWVVVPPGTTELTIAIAGAGATAGDADLFVYSGNSTNAQIMSGGATNRLCRPYLAGSTETCPFSNPLPRIYYIMVDPYESFAGISLSVKTKP